MDDSFSHDINTNIEDKNQPGISGSYQRLSYPTYDSYVSSLSLNHGTYVPETLDSNTLPITTNNEAIQLQQFNNSKLDAENNTHPNGRKASSNDKNGIIKTMMLLIISVVYIMLLFITYNKIWVFLTLNNAFYLQLGALMNVFLATVLLLCSFKLVIQRFRLDDAKTDTLLALSIVHYLLTFIGYMVISMIYSYNSIEEALKALYLTLSIW